MQITVLTVGKRLPEWINSGVKEYTKRFPQSFSVQIIEVESGKRSRAAAKENAIKEEAQSILSRMPKNNYTIALDERSKQADTMSLARQIEHRMQDGQDISFIIGGADGLDHSVSQRANSILSLSNFTLPHALVRVFLLEQLYRTWSILNKHPYHRE